MTCIAHHWLVQSVEQKPVGSDFVDAVCKHCGETRDFVAFSPADLFSPRTAMSAEKRRSAMASIGKPGKTTRGYA